MNAQMRYGRCSDCPPSAKSSSYLSRIKRITHRTSEGLLYVSLEATAKPIWRNAPPFRQKFRLDKYPAHDLAGTLREERSEKNSRATQLEGQALNPEKQSRPRLQSIMSLVPCRQVAWGEDVTAAEPNRPRCIGPNATHSTGCKRRSAQAQLNKRMMFDNVLR